jgi:hypothetical protein
MRMRSSESGEINLSRTYDGLVLPFSSRIMTGYEIGNAGLICRLFGEATRRAVSARISDPGPARYRSGLSLSAGDELLSEENFGLHAPQSVHSNLWSDRSRRVGCCSIRASFIGLRHLGQVSFAKRSKDMMRFLCEHLAGSARTTVALFAGENLGNAVPLAEPLGSMNSRQKG